ncbi:hypothetical protein [Microbacterium sp. MMO-153]|uniref:hypothetical protein n=1 Tax=Microbacterium sp. MMO-153 TaxID=3081275 RepID=UPI003015A388
MGADDRLLVTVQDGEALQVVEDGVAGVPLATDWLRSTWHTLLDLDARIASGTATGHLRSATADDGLREARAHLADRYRARSEEIPDLVRAYEQAQSLRAADTERRIRAALTPTSYRTDPAPPVGAGFVSTTSVRR